MGGGTDRNGRVGLGWGGGHRENVYDACRGTRRTRRGGGEGVVVVVLGDLVTL